MSEVSKVGVLPQIQTLSMRRRLGRLVGAGSHVQAARRVERSPRRNHKQGMLDAVDLIDKRRAGRGLLWASPAWSRVYITGSDGRPYIAFN